VAKDALLKRGEKVLVIGRPGYLFAIQIVYKNLTERVVIRGMGGIREREFHSLKDAILLFKKDRQKGMRTTPSHLISDEASNEGRL
jgi:hypothetical protein